MLILFSRDTELPDVTLARPGITRGSLTRNFRRSKLGWRLPELPTHAMGGGHKHPPALSPLLLISPGARPRRAVVLPPRRKRAPRRRGYCSRDSEGLGVAPSRSGGGATLTGTPRRIPACSWDRRCWPATARTHGRFPRPRRPSAPCQRRARPEPPG